MKQKAAGFLDLRSWCNKWLLSVYTPTKSSGDVLFRSRFFFRISTSFFHSATCFCKDSRGAVLRSVYFPVPFEEYMFSGQAVPISFVKRIVNWILQ
jgi:hypothetical protein